MTKKCQCGCGESLEGRRPNVRYVNAAHAERARRRRRDPETGNEKRRAAQLEGLYQSGKDGLRDAVRRDLAWNELLPAVFKGRADTANMDFDQRGHQVGSWRSIGDEQGSDRTERDAARHPRGRLGQKRRAPKRQRSGGSQMPPRGGRYGPTGPLTDYRDGLLYKILGGDDYRQLVRRFALALKVVNQSPLGRLAEKMRIDAALGYSELFWVWSMDRTLRRKLGYETPTEQLVEGEKMSPTVATDQQVAQTVHVLEACRDVLSDCIEIVRSRFPDDERIESAVERLVEITQD
jgi:hypothetical protein